jgi:maltooligosyltrehalose trehalohydrolase
VHHARVVRAQRRVPIGAELVTTPEPGVHFRVWAPAWRELSVVLEAPAHREVRLAAEPGGYFSGAVGGIGAGARYRFRLGDTDRLLADPASRFQPEGVFGPSEVVDPAAFAWTDAAWRGIEPHRHVLYELHVGTFTPGRTFASAMAELPRLAALGITTLEVMPVAEFPGARNWGYDGVFLFAPSRAYGTPDDLRRFVDRAHALGLGVILDVVYNHLGPAGCTLLELAPGYRSARHRNEWGDPLDFDGPDSAPVRELVLANAGTWIDEYHLDGLRLDATQSIVDESGDHIVAAIARRARAAGGDRRIFLVGENESQDHRMVTERGLDALWNDDFHHPARIAATGTIDGYLRDYRGSPQELISAIERGFLYQGQRYSWQRNTRGTSSRGMRRASFVTYLENHDQAANGGFGERMIVLASAGQFRALTAVVLLSPSIPLLFQGQEFGSRRPWLFFVDHSHDPGLVDAVRAGRAEWSRQFSSLATPEAQVAMPDPADPATFSACVLRRDLDTDPRVVALHRDLLALRASDPVFTDQRPDAVAGAVVDHEAFVLRYAGDAADGSDDRLLVVNLGRTYRAASIPEPLVAPPARMGWRTAWSSEHPAYGGRGTPPVFTIHGAAIPGHAAVLLVPDRAAWLRIEPPPPGGDKERPEP